MPAFCAISHVFSSTDTAPVLRRPKSIFHQKSRIFVSGSPLAHPQHTFRWPSPPSCYKLVDKFLAFLNVDLERIGTQAGIDEDCCAQAGGPAFKLNGYGELHEGSPARRLGPDIQPDCSGTLSGTPLRSMFTC